MQVRLYGKGNYGGWSSYTAEADNVEDRWLNLPVSLKLNVLRAGAAEIVDGPWRDATSSQIEKRVNDIRAGLVPNSFVLKGNVWVDACTQIGYKEDSKDNSIGPKKPIPVIPFEVFQDSTKFKNVDYMAAVRHMCKGV
jgi:hypothetical protein